MNFFEAQERARKNTAWLILLLFSAVALLVSLTYLFLTELLVIWETGELALSYDTLAVYSTPESFFIVTSLICLLIFCGSMYKFISLSGDGEKLAEMLGGRLLPQGSNDPQERQLLNVVEEMSIAAGMPIPRVYLIEGFSINAFAAGLSPADAVIGVTRGTMSRLSRDELQGVIAHEFSHIFNGDMQLNIRLIGVLHGILLIGMIGYVLLRTSLIGFKLRKTKGYGSSKFRGPALILPVLFLGLGLMVIGYAGTLLGQLIKAMVSRQREYLADSSAVQFTRNKDGIAGALKKIGGAGVGSTMNSPAAAQYSHGYFANGIDSFWQPTFAVHPPLEKRIKRIDPGWDGKFLPSLIRHPLLEGISKEKTAEDIRIAAIAATLSTAEQAISQVGTLNEVNVDYVHDLILSIPVTLRIASQNAFSARALVYAFLIGKQKSKKNAWSALKQYADRNIPALTEKYLTETRYLNEKYKLPLLELSVNTLRELSPNQYVQFKQAVHRIIISDKRVDLNEWIIQRLVVQQLDQYFGFRKSPKAKYASLDTLKTEVETLLSLIAYAENKDDAKAKMAFDAGANVTKVDKPGVLLRQDLNLDALNRSLDNLMQLKPLIKPRLLKACVTTILDDGKTTTKGIELVRTISTCLNCPMPPIPS